MSSELNIIEIGSLNLPDSEWRPECILPWVTRCDFTLEQKSHGQKEITGDSFVSMKAGRLSYC